MPRGSIVGAFRRSAHMPPLKTTLATRCRGYNTPTSSLTVTLPPITAISAGWTMGFASDNGKTMTVQVNGASGGHILYPAGATGSAGNSVTLAPVNYEFLALQDRKSTL